MGAREEWRMAASVEVCSTSSRRGTSASECMKEEDDKVEAEDRRLGEEY